MGVLNVTPDSFSDGGMFLRKADAIRRSAEMVKAGADIIDVGGESTRPLAKDISAEAQMARVLPVIAALAKDLSVPISIDTRKAGVAAEAMKAGASIINDVSGLRHDPEMAQVAAKYRAAVILMHMRSSPKDMQSKAVYRDVVRDVIKELRHSIKLAKAAGIKDGAIIIDPGIGFSKTVNHNLQILNRLQEFKMLNRPICIGTSRKSFIGKILNKPDERDRLIGTIATSVIGIINGANIIRVHDVAEAKEASRMTDTVLRGANA